MASTRKSSSSDKQQASLIDSKGKISTSEAKKRPALTDITNQRRVVTGSGKLQPKSAPYASKIVSIKKGSSSSISFSGDNLPPQSFSRDCVVPSKNYNVLQRSNLLPSKTIAEDDSNAAKSLHQYDESMSICDSLNSQNVDNMCSNVTSDMTAIGKTTSYMLSISKDEDISEDTCKQEMNGADKLDGGIFDTDENADDPQSFKIIHSDMYEHLLESEAKKRPATNYMEKVQKHINISMRGVLIEWLVEVAEEYNLVSETLYLAVNYIDRYLSGNVMDTKKLQLLGITCMMIASKYEEISPPRLDEFCCVTDYTYKQVEVLEMESSILNYLKFELMTPTVNCFSRIFVRAELGFDKAPLAQFECLANYVGELSILNYDMLRFAPSLIAASSIFLAKYILVPSERPWNVTLQHYTHYTTSDLRDCVIGLHSLCCDDHVSKNLTAIREKYNQQKYEFVSKKYCPTSIPVELFEDTNNGI